MKKKHAGRKQRVRRVRSAATTRRAGWCWGPKRT